MEEINRSLVMDSKSVQSLSTISRNNSITSDLNSTCLDEDKISISSTNCTSPSININMRWITKWGEVVNNYGNYNRRKSYIKDLMKQSGGVPHHYRPLVWQLLCGATDDTNPQSSAIRSNYPEYLKLQSPCEKAIRRDIARTYPQHEMFKNPESEGQELLYKIMKAYSIHDREVGYCQGSGFIGGLLLIHMPEEEAFAVLVQMMYSYQLRNLYKPNMSELGLYMHQLDCLVEEALGRLSQHFRAHNFHATVYASGWFLTLFTLPFSIELASRVMDLFMLEGMDIIFKISLAYLTVFQDELLKLDMESMLRFLQSVAPQELETNSDRLFDLAVQMKLNTKRMKKAEKEYSVLKMEEEENQVELRRLKTENGLLLQRIDRLEKETESLTQSLVVQKLHVAEQASDLIQSRTDLVEARRQAENLRSNLSEAETQLRMTVAQLNGRMSDQKSRELSNSDGIGFDLVQQLQTELVNIRLKEAETNAAYRELKDKYRILEENNEQLSKTPTEEVARLQEDLVALKLREAETGLSLKDTHRKMQDLIKVYKAHIESCPASESGGGGGGGAHRQRQHSVHEGSGDAGSAGVGLLQLARRVVETEHASEFQRARQRLMQLEAQQEITERQLQRRDEHLMRLSESLTTQQRSHKDLRIELHEADRRCVDLETKRKEDLMMWKIQRMELESQMTEMRQRLAGMDTHHCSSLHSSSTSGAGSGTNTGGNASTGVAARSKWKDLPSNIMTESIGPLEEICFTPDDPMITSIYIQSVTGPFSHPRGDSTPTHTLGPGASPRRLPIGGRDDASNNSDCDF